MRMQSLLLVLAVSAAPVVAQTRVTSPDKRNEVQVGIHEGGLYYVVQRDGTPLLTPSRLGFVFRGAPPLRDSLSIVDSSRSTFDETWTQPWGEVRRVRNHYNELKVSVQENDGAAASVRAGGARVQRRRGVPLRVPQRNRIWVSSKSWTS